MISREQVEALLKINGLPVDAPDDYVRTVLLSARYSQDEVEAAIHELRSKNKPLDTGLDPNKHKVFRSDQTLHPKEISDLLGIEVDASQFVNKYQRSRTYANLQFIAVWVFSFVFAAAGIMLFMYMNQVGWFHPTVTPPIDLPPPPQLSL